MQKELLDCIHPVIRRLRRLRFWQSLGWLAWTLVALVYLWRLLSSQPFTPASSVAIASTCLCLIVLCFIQSRLRVRNVQNVARQIEHRYPDLDQRLITAVDDSVARQPEAYLNQRVIREARDHARRNDWPDVVSRRWMWFSRLFGMSGTVTALALAALFSLAKPDAIVKASSVALPRPDVIIQPGNTEIERGTNLLVTAEFQANWISQQSAVEPELVLTETLADGPINSEDADSDEENSPRTVRLPMRRSMADPIWGGLASEVDESFTYRIELPHWSSESFRVDVFEYPSVTRSDAEIAYPTFTGLEDRRIENTVRISVAEGSQVTWWIRVNKPIQAAKLLPKPYRNNSPETVDPQPIELRPNDADPLWWSASFEVNQSQRFDVWLQDDRERLNQKKTQLSVRMLPNQAAKIRATIGGDLSVSALEEFPVAAEVRDDHGIARAGVTLTFADQPPRDVVLTEDVPSNQKRTIQYMVDMESLGAKPDQLLSYSFWAEDAVATDESDNETRRTQGDLYFAEVRRFEEIFREGDAQPSQPSEQPSPQQQQAEELADLQKQIIQATWKLSQNMIRFTDEVASDTQVIAESQQDAIAQLDELAQELQDVDSKRHAVDTRQAMEKAVEELTRAIELKDKSPLTSALVSEQAAYAGLLRLRASEFQVTRSQQQQQQSQGSSSQRRQQQLNELELDQDENRYETQQQAQLTPEQQAQRETRQVLSRLAELARRQQDLNEELAQLQSALQLADDEEEKEELRRQLERLREQQQDMLRQTDEVMERMNSPENAAEMQEASQQLEQTRENIREAAEALQQQDAASALSSGKRAERELETVREEIREQAAGQFDEAMQTMREQARELSSQQEQIEEQLSNLDSLTESPGLRSSGSREELQDALNQQRESLGELMDDIEQVVQEAEEAEPLLAQNLYDAFRETQQRRAEERLDAAGQLLERGFDPQSQQMAEQAGQAIDELTEQIEAAAENVLGNEAEALQRAANLAEQLQSAVEDEMRQERSQNGNDSDGESTANASEQPPTEQGSGQASNQSNQPEAGQGGETSDSDSPSPGGAPSTDPEGSEEPMNDSQPSENQESPPSELSQEQQGSGGGQGQGQSQQQGQPSSEQQPSSAQQPSSEQQPGEQQGQPNGGQQSSGQQPGDQPRPGPPGLRPQSPGQSPSQTPSQNPSPSESRSRQGGSNPSAAQAPSTPSDFASPLLGEGFREWSDGLRDIEEMVSDPELRSRATRIRERAREMRQDIRRESKAPQWNLVEEMIVEPMRELQRDLAEEFMRRSTKKQSLVPIDRDPVPDEYTEAVRQYYERIGSGL
ncbi:hypothetical protein [Rhodopirellula halodulae]|uniref:hypothetical protein n=1 Tax=Rhodopirellula halodulae TaxID=2894198 RepID=UPI001E4A0C59|nr:hypothetical protein [Rhodopirellula sp. JC737]MCC9657262.1 hypothetical protein [Rhodopirellula sp. JC737]